MNANVVVLAPVLARPERVAPLIESLNASTSVTPVDLLFIVSPGDDAERKAVVESGALYFVANWAAGPGDWARKHNEAVRRHRDRYEFFLLGADDLHFHPGWVEAAVATQLRTQSCVIGTNDLGNSRVLKGHHSTHPFVHRDYWACGTIDEPDKMLHEGYGHWFVDDEFSQTAISRRTYAHAHDAVVEHLHPSWGKSKDDATYRRGQATTRADQALYQARKHLWGA